MDIVTYAILLKKIKSALSGISTMKLGSDGVSIDIKTNDGKNFNIPIPEAKTTSDILSGVDCGNIKVGDTVKSGKNLQEFAEMLLVKELTPAVSFSTTISDGKLPTDIREKGIPIDVSEIKAIVTKRSNNISSVVWSGAISYTESSVSPNTNTYIQSKTNISDTTTFTVTAIDDKGLVGKESLTLTFVEPMRKLVIDGSLDINTITEADLTNCDKLLNIKKGFTDSYTVTGQKIGIAYPQSYGYLTAIWDTTLNMNIITGFKKRVIDVTTASGVVPYIVYLGGSNSTVVDCEIKYEW